MVKRFGALLMATLMITAILSFAGSVTVFAAEQTFVLPLNGGTIMAGSPQFNVWSVENTPGLTSEMLQTANRLEVRTTQSSSAFNAGRGLSLYVNGHGNGWWDDTHITEVGQNPSGVYTFNLEWKRGLFAQPSPGDNLSLGCSWWNQAWTTTRSNITSITLVYGGPYVHTPVNQIGTPLAAGNENAGRIRGEDHINAADITMLRRYLSATNFIHDRFIRDNAFITSANSISAADVTRLRRYVAGEDVSLGVGDGPVPVEDRPIQRNAKWFVKLTFDDGPVMGPSTTGASAATIEALANAKSPCGVAARATWFWNPRRFTTQKYPIIQRAVALGHDIENHAWSHGQSVPGPQALTCRTGSCTHFPGGANCWGGIHRGLANTSTWNATEFRWDTQLSSDVIENVTGRRPLFYRFNQFVSGGGQGAIVNELGMHVIHAQMDSRDFTSPPVSSVVNLLRTGGGIDGTTYSNINIGGWNGVNMLFHDAGGDASSFMYTQNNVQIMAQAIPYLQGLGYAFVTVEEFFYRTGTSPANGAGGAQFNGHFGHRNWQSWDSAVVMGRFPACPPGYYGVYCHNPLCNPNA